ncbi:hypothetical protein ElyMa_005437100 [Elysia marginata]|uniref:Uncharacterized protein n=1 Tax=Elysia marginata TaxID=1093978 RepID=A0AAV4ELG5_9GAST|nr:hypothetical protein ElyMa_005437100 [Elysia marginata]
MVMHGFYLIWAPALWPSGKDTRSEIGRRRELQTEILKIGSAVVRGGILRFGPAKKRREDHSPDVVSGVIAHEQVLGFKTLLVMTLNFIANLDPSIVIANRIKMGQN